ncbi:MAG: hypothetical protein ACJAS1_005298 [Oleiphilaceae bacterium]|jgi:hypothetical protein
MAPRQRGSIVVLLSTKLTMHKMFDPPESISLESFLQKTA